MSEKEEKIIASFFSEYNNIIQDKLNNGDYKLKNRYVTIIINDRYDVLLYPFNSSSTKTLSVSIIRYTDITGHARKYDIYDTYGFYSNEINSKFKLFTLYYGILNKIYSTFNGHVSISINFDDVNTDLRKSKIENLI